MTNIIAASRQGYEGMPQRLERKTGEKFELIKSQTELTVEYLKKVAPQYVFFPHWSYIIPREIYESFECVIFHMTDLPYGRGGSPLQNLISRGIYETKISALQCAQGIDAGPIYMKVPFNLYGTAEEIYLRASQIIEDMIVEILQKKPQPVEQTGEIVTFTRRKPEQSNIDSIADLNKLFDHIRMLDAEGYPPAFLENECFTIEFHRASLKGDHIICDAIIKPRGCAKDES